MTLPTWAEWEAIDPDGARMVFSCEPEPVLIAGVFANEDGTDYEFRDPVWVWEPIDEDGVFQFAGYEAPPEDWRATKRRLGQQRLDLVAA